MDKEDHEILNPMKITNHMVTSDSIALLVIVMMTIMAVLAHQ